MLQKTSSLENDNGEHVQQFFRVMASSLRKVFLQFYNPLKQEKKGNRGNIIHTYTARIRLLVDDNMGKQISSNTLFIIRPMTMSVQAITPRPTIPVKSAPPVERYNRYNQPGYNRYDQERLHKDGILHIKIIIIKVNDVCFALSK